MSKRVAAIDCGTNSVRLLIAEVDPRRAVLTDLAREMRIVRLGEGVDRTGRLSEAALDRTTVALREYSGLIGRFSPAAVRMVATSATRDAENSQEFVDRVKEVLGVAPEVVTGDEEASLSFTGATREIAGTPLAQADCCPPPYLVTDILKEFGNDPSVVTRVDPTKNGWRRYRIPLTDSLRVRFGSPDLTIAQHVRVWLEGVRYPEAPPDTPARQDGSTRSTCDCGRQDVRGAWSFH